MPYPSLKLACTQAITGATQPTLVCECLCAREFTLPHTVPGATHITVHNPNPQQAHKQVTNVHSMMQQQGRRPQAYGPQLF